MSGFLQSRSGRALLLIGRLGLGGIFLYAAYTKLQLPWISFAATIYNYQLIPDAAVTFVARTLPWFELLLGVWLVVGAFWRWAAALTSALLLGFFVIMVRSYALGLDIDCGCFGPGDKLSAMTLVRDGALLALSLALTVGGFLQTRRKREESAAVPAAGLPESTA